MGWVVGIGDWRFLELKIKMMLEAWQTIKFSLYFLSILSLGRKFGACGDCLEIVEDKTSLVVFFCCHAKTELS